MKIESITESNGLSFRITEFDSSYNSFIEMVKSEIPADGRHYFPNEKRWWIDNRYIERFRNIYRKYFKSNHQEKLF